MEKTKYDKSFYEAQSARSLSSARAVLAIVNRIVKPKSVVDVGCGVGPWLRTAIQLGATDVAGMDGDYVDRNMLMFPADKFSPIDLRNPQRAMRRFDMAICVEVAEHVPDSSADPLVDFLTQSSDVVLFSAAIPGQGGTDHINEQWPAYWFQRFSRRGYECFDCIRPVVYGNPSVDPWYAQNALLYVQREAVAKYPELQKWRVPESGPAHLVHPAIHGYFDYYRLQGSQLPFRYLVGSIVRNFQDRLRKR